MKAISLHKYANSTRRRLYGHTRGNNIYCIYVYTFKIKYLRYFDRTMFMVSNILQTCLEFSKFENVFEIVLKAGNLSTWTCFNKN